MKKLQRGHFDDNFATYLLTLETDKETKHCIHSCSESKRKQMQSKCFRVKKTLWQSRKKKDATIIFEFLEGVVKIFKNKTKQNKKESENHDTDKYKYEDR